MRNKHLMLAGPMLLGSALALPAAIDQWTGGADSGDFNHPANWSPGVPGPSDTAQFNRPAATQPVLGAADAVAGIDFVTPGGGWILSGPGPLTLGPAGLSSSGQTSGVNTISVASLILGSGSFTTWHIFSTAPASTTPVFNVSSAIQLNPSGQLIFKLERASGGGVGTLNLTGPITGTSSGGVRFAGTAYNRNTINLSGGAGASSYDAPTVISQAILNFEHLAGTGAASSFGSAGTVTLGDNNSFACASYYGRGGTTDRPWLLGGAGGGSINNNGTGPVAFTSTGSAIAGSGNRRLQLGGTNTANNLFAELLADVGGTTAFIKNDAGTWTLANPANSYTGTNTLNGGTLQVQKLDLGGRLSSLGASGNTAAHLVFNNATLNYTGSGDTCDRLFQMSGNATFNNYGSGPLNLDNPGAITQAGTGARTLTLGGSYAGVNTFAASVGDNAAGGTQTSLTKSGAGTWLLTGAHSYSGTTTVREGKLLVNGSLGSGPVLVGPGATLGGNGGTITGPVTIQNGGTLALGGSLATLNIKNTLTLSGASACVMKLGKSGSKPGSDLVQGVSTLSYGGTLTVTASGVTFAPGDSFQLFKAANYSGTFASIHLPPVPGNLSWDISGLASSGTLRVTGSPAIAAVPAGTTPEPGSPTKRVSPPRGVTGPADAAPTSGKSNLAMWLIAGVLVVLAAVLAWVVIMLKRVVPKQARDPRSTASFAVEEQATEGDVKLRSESSGERGGDSLSPRFQAHAHGDKLSPPRNTELDTRLQAPAVQAGPGLEPAGLSPNHQANEKATKEGFRGELKQVGLQDVIQLQCLTGKSCILEISNQGSQGRVFIEKGEIVHATVAELSGEPALFKLLALTGGEFSLKPYEAPAERTINGPWVELLMEAARTRDEAPATSEEKNSEGFRAAAGGPEDVLAMAALLRDHPQVKELLVSTGSGEVLEYSGSAQAEGRRDVCAALAEVTRSITPLMVAGECKQVEILTEDSRSVLTAEQGCNLFVRIKRDGTDLPL